MKKQDDLLPFIFLGSGPNGTWTQGDWDYYNKYKDWIWGNPELWNRGADNGLQVKGWDLFALHAQRLASHYGPGQRDQFVRDFALVFAGIPEGNIIIAGINGLKGPVYRSLNYSNDGLDRKYLDVDNTQSQSHHYAGLFALGYFSYEPSGLGIGGADAINLVRDISNPYNPGDLNLGYAAIAQGAFVSSGVGDFSDLSTLISELK